jgi:hypothetical protein
MMCFFKVQQNVMKVYTIVACIRYLSSVHNGAGKEYETIRLQRGSNRRILNIEQYNAVQALVRDDKAYIKFTTKRLLFLKPDWSAATDDYQNFIEVWYRTFAKNVQERSVRNRTSKFDGIPDAACTTNCPSHRAGSSWRSLSSDNAGVGTRTGRLRSFDDAIRGDIQRHVPCLQ